MTIVRVAIGAQLTSDEVAVQSNLDYLDYLNPQLSELQIWQKVQVKVQISDAVSICACALEYSAAIICFVIPNDSQEH